MKGERGRKRRVYSSRTTRRAVSSPKKKVLASFLTQLLVLYLVVATCVLQYHNYRIAATTQQFEIVCNGGMSQSSFKEDFTDVSGKERGTHSSSSSSHQGAHQEDKSLVSSEDHDPLAPSSVQKERSPAQKSSSGEKNQPHSDKQAASLPTNQTIHASSSSNPPPILVDMLSIGSMLQPEQQEAQQATFGSHPQVRIFYAAQEKDDFDPNCHKQLKDDDVRAISQFCRKDQPDGSTVKTTKEERKQREEKRKTMQFPRMFDINRYFYGPKELLNKTNPAGWLCAQTRPISALGKLVRRYREDALPFPDYLFLIDDDTYVNVNRTLDHLAENNPSEELNVVAGCLMTWRDESFTIPFGGFGTIFSKKSLERLTRPLYCSEHFASINRDAVLSKKPPKTYPNDYEKFACSRILLNQVNEFQFFKDGMSILEVFEAYTRKQPYRNHLYWAGTGFCFHSDHLTGYIVNTYEIGSARSYDNPVNKAIKSNRFDACDNSVLSDGFGSPNKKKTGNRCFHTNRFGCKKKNNHICHYISPQRMRFLYSDYDPKM